MQGMSTTQQRRAKRFRQHPHDPGSTTTVWLALAHERTGDATWAVYETETSEEPMGYLHRYTGSIDRVVERVRYPGKRRTFWSASHSALDSNAWMYRESAADALRWLLRR